MSQEFFDQLIALMADPRPGVAVAAGQLMRAVLGPQGLAKARLQVDAEIKRRRAAEGG